MFVLLAVPFLARCDDFDVGPVANRRPIANRPSPARAITMQFAACRNAEQFAYRRPVVNWPLSGEADDRS